MDCRIELNIRALDHVEEVRAETGDKTFDLWSEATWNDVAHLSVEGSRDFCARVASWALEEHKSDGECSYEDDKCVCGDTH